MECVDTKSDPRNCGSCGKACQANEVCMAGSCAASCGMGTMKCGMSCVNTMTDPTNCGGCGTLCTGGQTCSGGKCGLSCQPGLTKCNIPASDGGADGGLSGDVCTNTQTDNSNCGSCGNACASTELCYNGACAKRYGPVHNFVNMPADHFITQGGCSPSGGQSDAADADYFCKHFYNSNTCFVLPGFKKQTCPTLLYPKMHKNGGCTSNGTDIPNTTCTNGACKVGNWSEFTLGLNNIVCVCP